MRVASYWNDYELIDASAGEKLERWGDVTLIRPDPQVLWNTPKEGLWQQVNAHYRREKTGGGRWDINNLTHQEWDVAYRSLRFRIRPTGFKHTGLFPEQAVNWDLITDLIQNSSGPVEVLNLFAYTGGATLACASAGASVVHVDAAKGMVQWARENINRTGLSDAPVRWIVDDCKKFIEREHRRGNRYRGIIMDPPSYGRGPGGEVWKLEDSIDELVALAGGLLSEDAVFFLLNSYTTGLSASVMGYLLALHTRHLRGKITADEIGLPVTATGLVLPQGASAVWVSDKVC